MRLLILTQAVDKNDPVLGFMHDWLTQFAKKFDSVLVICLKAGNFDLPKNVTVYSLGKESSTSKAGYILKLFKYLFLISGSYDRVFVHMNEEYVLLAGLYWKIKNIPVYLWRNHPKGSFLTRVAVFLSTGVFCTSKDSFTARYKKTTVMPAGINTDLFKPIPGAVRKKYSICMIGRISPIKHVDMGVEAVELLVQNGFQVSFAVIGSPGEKNMSYFEKIKDFVTENNLTNTVAFLPAVIQDKLPEIYSSFDICLNLTDSGSFDKTIVEAASCGAMPLVSNSSLSNLLPMECLTLNNKENIADSIKKLLEPHVKIKIEPELLKFSQSQSLSNLIDKLYTIMNSNV